MARKKTMVYVPLEERPEFIAAVEALPSDPAELELRASRVRFTVAVGVLFARTHPARTFVKKAEKHGYCEQLYATLESWQLFQVGYTFEHYNTY